MLEIELKAHVYNKEELINNLKTFATYERTVEKKDTYYHLPVSEGHITCRLREEIQEGNNKKHSYILTYKRKELRTDKDGSTIEVNDEKEIFVENFSALQVLFCDLKGEVYIRKYKKVIDYYYLTEYGKAEIEICDVEKLGTFVEIEILSDNNNEENIKKIKEELKRLLKLAGIPLENIEKRYYSEMLKDLESKERQCLTD